MVSVWYRRQGESDWVWFDDYKTEAVARINADFLRHDGREVKIVEDKDND